jgi:hypothetical protein
MRSVRLLQAGLVLGTFVLACPKGPEAPCTGRETWPDPCAYRTTETASDASLSDAAFDGDPWTFDQ